MACWDMRFQLPISSHCHPSRARIRRLSMHPLYQSWVIAGKVEGQLLYVGGIFLEGVFYPVAKTYVFRVLLYMWNKAWFCSDIIDIWLSYCIYSVQTRLWESWPPPSVSTNISYSIYFLLCPLFLLKLPNIFLEIYFRNLDSSFSVTVCCWFVFCCVSCKLPFPSFTGPSRFCPMDFWVRHL